MLYDFDTVINRWHTDSEKYDGLKKFAPKAPDNSIPLWIADMDFKTAPEIIAAMHRRVEEGIFGYTDIYDASYYKAVCRWKNVTAGALHRMKSWWIQAWCPLCLMPCR